MQHLQRGLTSGVQTIWVANRTYLAHLVTTSNNQQQTIPDYLWVCDVDGGIEIVFFIYTHDIGYYHDHV